MSDHTTKSPDFRDACKILGGVLLVGAGVIACIYIAGAVLLGLNLNEKAIAQEKWEYAIQAEAKTAAWAEAIETCNEVTDEAYPGCIQRNYTDPVIGEAAYEEGGQ